MAVSSTNEILTPVPAVSVASDDAAWRVSEVAPVWQRRAVARWR